MNLVEILKNVPIGTKLYSPICGECELICTNNGDIYPITVKDKYENTSSFTFDGKYHTFNKDGECLLFPSKENRDWNNFSLFKPGDPIWVRDSENHTWKLRYFNSITKDNRYKVSMIRYNKNCTLWLYAKPFIGEDPNN